MFLCYDITREDTFKNLEVWLNDIKQHAAENVQIYLIGGKADLEDDRQVEKEQALAFCQENSIAKHFETSSMTGFNVEEVFSLAAKDLYVRVMAAKAEKEKAEAEEE